MTQYKVTYTTTYKASMGVSRSGGIYADFDDAYAAAKERFNKWGNAAIVEMVIRTFDLVDVGWKVRK